MNDYFIIAYEKEKVLRQIEVESEGLIIKLHELQKNGAEIINIRDSFLEYHDLNDMIEIFKESIDIEYEDVTSKIEAYNIAYEYYKNLYRNNYIDKEIYNKYFLELKKYRKEIKDKNQFIEKVKDLQVKGV